MSKDTMMKTVLWLVPVIFGAGGFYSMMSSSASQLSHDVAEIKIELEEHRLLKAHPVTEERISTILTEQRAVRAEQKEQGEAIAAICAATNARCP